ncbi:hypothetical protein ScPMuIL_015182 [Solemya velum]
MTTWNPTHVQFTVLRARNLIKGKGKEWPKWFQRFQRFRIVTDLGEKEGEVQVNTLLYSMGSDAEDVFKSFKLSDDQAKDYNAVVEKFEKYFVARRNVIFERAKFNKRRQEEGETAEAFITSLHTLVEYCDYGTLTEQMVRDRIVVGIRDSALSEKLQLDPDLTLEKCITQVRQKAAVKKQQSIVRDEIDISDKNSQAASVNSIRQTGKKRGQYNKRFTAKPTIQKDQPRNRDNSLVSTSRMNSSSYGNGQNKKACSKCGNEPHQRSRCPARDATCHKCHKKGHYGKCCYAVLNEVRELNSDSEADYAFVGVITDKKSCPWNIKLEMNSVSVDFKIDTGADVTAISVSDFRRIGRFPLQETNKILYGPGQSRLDVMGKFSCALKGTDSETTQDVFVIRNLSKSLLGRPAIEKLGLLKIVGSVRDSTRSIEQRYPQLFRGLGKTSGEYHITLRENSHPFSLSVSRRIPFPLRDKVRHELDRMQELEVISPVDQPTEWCAPMVVVPKKENKVRICVDLTQLNKSVLRERHQLPSVDQTLGQLSGARIFSKIDANSGFWQIPLDRASRLLTTFITPFGRYCFNRLPFGISSAPEYFQKRMTQLLDGISGVVCQMDDVLVYGSTQLEHDTRLDIVLNKLRDAGLTLNRDKCKFSTNRVTFVGHVIDENGVQPDPNKVRAIVDMEPPSCVTEVRRFMGMVNQLGKFSSNIAEQSEPIRSLLKKGNAWTWDQQQTRAFEAIKRELSSDPILAHYDPHADSMVSADASSFGLGTVLLQRKHSSEKDDWSPVAYASRAMSETEQRYAQVEKEALAVTWACERFAQFLIGKHFQIRTDHRPLVALLGSKPISDLPPRIQRFRMRLMRFEYSIHHVPGKELYTADALSRAPIAGTLNKVEEEFVDAVGMYVDSIVQQIPATGPGLEEIRMNLETDPVCKVITEYCLNGWPGYEKPSITTVTRPYWQIRDELSVCHGLLLRGSRLVIPTIMRAEVLHRIHEGHQGIVKCRERARNSVWWPGISKDIEYLVRNCANCVKHRADKAEPLISTAFPDYPWQKLGTDLFHWRGATYLLIVDYFSRFIEIEKLKSLSSASVIQCIKPVFGRYGIPEVVVSDNGPQYNSFEFREFSSAYGFRHETSSPHYPQGNGEAERAVQTIKRVLSGAKDPDRALLAYRATPLKNGYSPAELLMGRKIRTTLPENPKHFVPTWPYLKITRGTEETDRSLQAKNFNRAHRATNLATLNPHDTVWVKTGGFGTVKEKVSDRSYNIQTSSGVVRRNRRHLVPSPPDMAPAAEMNESCPLSDQTRSIPVQSPPSIQKPCNELNIKQDSPRVHVTTRSKLTDVFVTIQLGKEKFQTSTIKNAHNPEWFEQCDLSISEMHTQVELSIMHRGILSDEFLGYAAVPLWEHNVFERPKSQWIQLSQKPSKPPDNKYRGDVEVRLVFQVKSKNDAITGTAGFRKRSPSIRSIASAVGQKVGDKLKFARSRSFRESRTSDNKSAHGKNNSLKIPDSAESERSRSYSVSLDRRSLDSNGFGRAEGRSMSVFSPGDRRSVTLPVNYSAFTPVGRPVTDDSGIRNNVHSPKIYVSPAASNPGYLESIFSDENEVYTSMRDRNCNSMMDERPKRPPRRSKSGHPREVSRSSDSDTEGSVDIVKPRVLRKSNPNPVRDNPHKENVESVLKGNDTRTENPNNHFQDFIKDIKQENEFRSSMKSNTVDSQISESQSQEQMYRAHSDSVDSPMVVNNLNVNGDETQSGSGTSSRKKITPEMEFRFGQSPLHDDNQEYQVKRRPKRDKLRQLYKQGGRRYTVQGLDHAPHYGYPDPNTSYYNDPRIRSRQDNSVPEDLVAVYRNMTKEELMRIVITTKAKLIRKDQYIKDLEKYIDQLLVRVMEASPRILQQ